MLMQTIERYLGIRRVAGFRLRVAEGFLRSYARFASERGEAYVRAQTVLDWVALIPSVSQRGRRLEAVTIFAQSRPGAYFAVSDLSTGRSSSQRIKFTNCWSRPRG